MAPNLAADRPIEEILIQPPKVDENIGDHGPHRVFSTYAKKDAFQINHFSSNQHDNNDTTTEVSTTTTHLQESTENSETDYSKASLKLERKSFATDSQEIYALRDETSLQKEDTIDEATPVYGVNMKTIPLVRNRVLPMGILPSPIVYQGAEPTSDIYNQGYRSHDLHRHPHSNLNLATYGLINSHPIFSSNGHIFYPGGYHIARDISNHPNIRLHAANPSLNPYDFNPAYRQHDSEASFTQPRITTVRSKPRKKSITSPRTRDGISSDQYDLFDFDKVFAGSSNLYHHQKSLEELTRHGKNIGVREDDWLLTGEGATAIILVGMCSIIMMLICLIFMMKKCKNGKNNDKMGDKIEEKKPPPAKGVSTLWMDLYNPVNLIPHISYLHTLPQVDIPKKSSSSLQSVTPTMPQLPLPYITVEDFTETNLGRLWFSVRYEPQKSNLHVNVRHARYPKGREISNNTGELWVEGIVLSDMNIMKATSKTNTRRATYSPVFNHSFLFLLSKDEVGACILKLALHDKHPKKEEQIVGCIILPLSSIDLTSDEIHCRDLI